MYSVLADCRANGEFLGGSCIDIPIRTSATEDLPFKGNMDVECLRQCVRPPYCIDIAE